MAGHIVFLNTNLHKLVQILAQIGQWQVGSIQKARQVVPILDLLLIEPLLKDKGFADIQLIETLFWHTQLYLSHFVGSFCEFSSLCISFFGIIFCLFSFDYIFFRLRLFFRLVWNCSLGLLISLLVGTLFSSSVRARMLLNLAVVVHDHGSF